MMRPSLLPNSRGPGAARLAPLAGALLLALPLSAAAETARDPVTGVDLGPSGARQSVHAVVSNTDRLAKRHELRLPLSLQINSRFTEHFATGLEYSYHPSERLGLFVGGAWYPYGMQTLFMENELLNKTNVAPEVSNLLLTEWEAHGGVEVTPIYGKFSVLDAATVGFGFYLGTGLGVAKTRIQIAPRPDSGTPAFGDTGLRPSGILRAGARLFFGRHVALRLEVRDTVFAGEVSEIEGCRLESAGGPLGGPSCNRGAIEPDKQEQIKRLLENPSSAVTHTVMLTGAISVIF